MNRVGGAANPWVQVGLVFFGLWAFISVGVLFLAGAGPGSEGILYVFIAGYAIILLLFRSTIARVFGAIFLILAIAGLTVSFVQRARFLRRMEMRHHLPSPVAPKTVPGQSSTNGVAPDGPSS